MCTFKITNDPNEWWLDEYLSLGGPDLSNSIKVNDTYITHHLLNITGDITAQPVKNREKYFMLVGEFYNWSGSYSSDIYYGIEMYNRHGNKFTDYVDGEFLFIVFDGNNIDFFNDPWSTRQVYYYQDNFNWYFTSLICSQRLIYAKEKIEAKDIGSNYRLPPNAHVRFNIDSRLLKVINDSQHTWNLDQYIDGIKEATKAFNEAVLKRWYPNCTLYLSSGVDSTAIALCLADNKKEFNAISVLVSEDVEDENVIDSTVEYCKKYINHRKLTKTDMDKVTHIPKSSISHEVNQQCKNYFNSKVALLGHGGDELLDGYRNKEKAEFYKWPEDQSTIFPWKHFYNGQTREILDYQETYSIFSGLEHRSIFYDKNLVQSWLNVDVKYKNIEYKHLQKTYLRERNIPLSTKPKAGFGSQTKFPREERYTHRKRKKQ